MRALHGNKEIIVADGGSENDTVERATASAARAIRCEGGRGSQMRAGAVEVTCFVHADTVPWPGALAAIGPALTDSRIVGGNFSLKFRPPL